MASQYFHSCVNREIRKGASLLETQLVHLTNAPKDCLVLYTRRLTSSGHAWTLPSSFHVVKVARLFSDEHQIQSNRRVRATLYAVLCLQEIGYTWRQIQQSLQASMKIAARMCLCSSR